ncbi:MAG: YfhO family protein, partial [Eubacterium sp.]|nr:YfhO family protein [Eubacterium sp.]
EAIYYGNRSNYGFYSSVDSEWLEFNKLLGNNQGYYKRVAPCSNDNRFGLDLLQSTRYFLGDSDGYAGASVYAGYGFEPYKTIDGVDVLKNKYFIGLGCVFSSYMRESEWMKLSYAERELALLNAVVIPDETEVPKGMTELKADSIDFGVTEIPYEIKKQTVDTLRISAENDDDHQVLLSFRNIAAEKTKGFTVRFDNGIVQKAVRNTIDNERGFADIDDLTVNLGRGADACRKIKIEISRQDVSWDDLVLYSIPVAAYDRAGEALTETGFVTEKFDNDYIKGRVESDKDGILYLSIFDDSGWDVYVDGEKATQISDVDIAFTGIPLKAGRHTIELTYHTRGLAAGAVVSLVGLLLALIISVRHKKHK